MGAQDNPSLLLPVVIFPQLLPGFPVSSYPQSKCIPAPHSVYRWVWQLDAEGPGPAVISCPLVYHLPPLTSCLSPQYLLSMVVEYFGRVGLPGHLYNRIHFFLAL